MHPALRSRLLALAATLALLFVAGGAFAQCLISGPSSTCGNPFQLCGPSGNYEYIWLDPAGNYGFSPCLTATDPGLYRLMIFDEFGIASGPCSLFVATAEPPVSEITGPTSGCEGEPVHLCGPAGNLDYTWSGPAGFTASTVCVDVLASGTYSLAVRPAGTQCPGGSADHVVNFAACGGAVVNCPRPAWFWKKQCLMPPQNSARIDRTMFASIATCVDAHAAIFAWNDELDGFCATLQPKPASLQARARRQFAAALANVCAGSVHLPPQGGQVVALDPSAPLTLPGTPATVGAWLSACEARLAQLASMPQGRRDVKDAYREIIRCGWNINHGRGIGPVCPRLVSHGDAAQVMSDTEDDPEEPLQAELTDDGSDMVELARATPNPFAASTSFTYVVSGSVPEQVSLAIYDISGRMVRELKRGPEGPGSFDVSWDGRGADGSRVQSGVYFLRGQIGTRQITGRLTKLQ